MAFAAGKNANRAGGCSRTTCFESLHVGCGAGQELLPFVASLGAFGTGVDANPEAGPLAVEQFVKLSLAKQVDFRCCNAESLPFEANTYDVGICRLALPHTRNREALSEIARVLHPGSLLIPQIHHARYYLRRVRRGVARGDILSVLRAARVLLASAFYHLLCRQPDNCILRREVF